MTTKRRRNSNCKICNTLVEDKYCPKCGQPLKLNRIDGNYILHEIVQILNFERGIFYTINELLLTPGKSIRTFISKNRKRLVKPIMFVIITSLIYSLINHFLKIEDSYIKYSETKESATGHIFKWVQTHYGYANIIMGIFISFWAKIFFKKYKYNFFEILILMCFVMGMGMLIYSIFALFQNITNVDLMQIAGIVGFVYSTWAIGQFFDKRKFSNYIKALISYFLGFLTFVLAIILTGSLIDLIINYYNNK